MVSWVLIQYHYELLSRTDVSAPCFSHGEELRKPSCVGALCCHGEHSWKHVADASKNSDLGRLQVVVSLDDSHVRCLPGLLNWKLQSHFCFIDVEHGLPALKHADYINRCRFSLSIQGVSVSNFTFLLYATLPIDDAMTFVDEP